MEDKIKQAFESISNDIKAGFNSVVALSEMAKDDTIDIEIKKTEKWQLNKK